MRAYVKLELVNNLQILDRSHDTLQKLLREGKNDDSYQLLIGCQKVAISIGEAVNTILGKQETVTAAKLEDYCEMLYQVGEEGKEFDRSLFRRKIGEVIAALDAEAPTEKIRVVFMPYKAELWDCFGSIYEAASDDDECDVKVVPLPYCIVDGSGNSKEAADETGLFSKELPVVSRKDYKLPEEHPEIIYIQNPRDPENMIVQPDPDYHPEALSHNCEKLIYVPCDILGSDPARTYENAPDYSHCDLIITADEARKKELAEAGTPASKLFAAGSPELKGTIGEKIHERAINLIFGR